MLGIPHRVDPSDLPEVPDSGELPERFAVRLAREKALQVAARHPGAPVLGADTVVVLGQQLMGKP
ncbi:MAG: Maf family protein, partial [Gemmatimonadetes bacterium]|nr:Maf family protein [Gemmatimonadota bacterium]